LIKEKIIGWLVEESFDQKDMDEAAVTDIQFELKGTLLPKDHGYALFLALVELMPWIADEPLLGIHPVQGAEMGDGNLMLNRRGKLVFRAPRIRVEDLFGLTGKEFQIAGKTFAIGAGKLRSLSWHTPLYAHCVTTGHEDEREFTQDILNELDAFKIDSRFICGKRQILTTAQGLESGYSLMLHGLAMEHALQIQEQGLGTNRKLGCGIFIPHKSIVAVS
jgi:CRISPR-associated protein Cas6